MSNKIQGEGDYEAARRFNKSEQEFVKRKFGKKHAADKGDSYLPEAEEQDEAAGESLDSDVTKHTLHRDT